ncbi:MAG TPA: hypothetical protein VG269_01300 [Tepidisphaeraceae bacterium]|jgi:antitoxin (DNA-binding transcriptional repressor) of toxin-antitoxin stability system|nr:hypothetical protein [Tepidisphaeraceae bacterium]
MNTLDVSKIGTLAQAARDAKNGPIILLDHDKPIAAVVPLDQTDLESLSLATNPDFIAMIERSRARHVSEGGVSINQARALLGLGRKGSRPKSPKKKRP